MSRTGRILGIFRSQSTDPSSLIRDFQKWQCIFLCEPWPEKKHLALLVVVRADAENRGSAGAQTNRGAFLMGFDCRRFSGLVGQRWIARIPCEHWPQLVPTSRLSITGAIMSVVFSSQCSGPHASFRRCVETNHDAHYAKTKGGSTTTTAFPDSTWKKKFLLYHVSVPGCKCAARQLSIDLLRCKDVQMQRCVVDWPDGAFTSDRNGDKHGVSDSASRVCWLPCCRCCRCPAR